ncbi:hypothetical protein OF83DRAFT_325425 [Amylostereum chailletii]|nr:hypothetical protein OF83DRAFT_325425 [Amylostereum chailletii]
MADAAQCPVPTAPDITTTFGIFILATILGSVFYGMTLLQAGLYFSKSGEDRARNKLLVTVLILFDTFAWILEVYTVWWYFVVNYANPAALPMPIWTLELEPGFTYTVAFLAQMFFIEKIYILLGSKVIAFVLTVLSIGAWGTGIGITGIVDLVSPTIDRINIAQKTLSTLVELIIAASMTYMFRAKRTGMSRTDSILNRLLVFALSRGILMCLVQILYTVTYFALHNTLIWAIFHFSLSKLCANSVIASLNVREIMRNGTSRMSEGASISLTKRMGASSSSSRQESRIVFSGDDIAPYTPGMKSPVRVQFSDQDNNDIESAPQIHVHRDIVNPYCILCMYL